jgi:heme-degrading monooxygenase HmoA
VSLSNAPSPPPARLSPPAGIFRPGFLGMDVRRGCEAVETYLLIVHWDRMEDHRDGFRRLERYEQWRALLHPFYDPMPVVHYFGEPV